MAANWEKCLAPPVELRKNDSPPSPSLSDGLKYCHFLLPPRPPLPPPPSVSFLLLSVPCKSTRFHLSVPKLHHPAAEVIPCHFSALLNFYFIIFLFFPPTSLPLSAENDKKGNIGGGGGSGGLMKRAGSAVGLLIASETTTKDSSRLVEV